MINETHDPKLRSWVESANDPATDFPIQNLPFCAFKRPDETEYWVQSRLGLRIGDTVIDLLRAAELLDSDKFGHDFSTFECNSLNGAMPTDTGTSELLEARRQLFRLLSAGNSRLRDNA